jgi:hypothetical protein
MVTDRVAFFAGEGHFLDHLAPVWHDLPDEYRAGFYVRDEDLVAHARARGLEPVVGVPEHGVLTYVAAIGDLRRVTKEDRRRPIVLAEHGAGQTYSSRHPSYAGGLGRENVVLFVVPNMHAAKRNRARYPRTPNAVVGCPKLDGWHPDPPAGPPVAVVSFHWRCKVAPETDTAYDHFVPVLESARAELERAGVELLAHAHPRLLPEAGPVFSELGLEVVEDFEEVVRRAHVYAVDNSSTLFEFAALDRPVVVLNSPRYRRGVEHGLRFWKDANVGVQVDHPEHLVAGILRALEDPSPVRRSRERAVARVYPVRDGTSAARAANAVLEELGVKRCLVCSSTSCSCTSTGEPANVVAVDQRVRSSTMPGSKKKRYKNPTGPGYVLLSDERARRMGLLEDVDAPAPTPAGASRRPAVPKGALAPGGPTARARAKAQADPEPAGAPAEGADEPLEPAEPGAPARQKKRDQPTAGSRRRRPAGEKAAE